MNIHLYTTHPHWSAYWVDTISLAGAARCRRCGNVRHRAVREQRR